MEYEKNYRGVMMRAGTVLIINAVLLLTLGSLPSFLRGVLPETGDIWERVFFETLSMFTYLLCFLIPAWLFRLMSPGRRCEPRRLEIRLPGETPLLILAGIAIVYSAAFVNSLLFGMFDFSELMESEPLDSPAAVVLQFMSLAVVPALCEEFLFRGVILSNILPYGRTAAVIGSAALFALMHQNFAQYFYTFCAGIVLGLAYLWTGSIWPGTFIHLFNNFSSTISSYIYDNYGELYAVRFDYAMTLLTLAGGLAAAVVLILRHGGKLPGEEEGAQPTGRYPVAPKALVRNFCAPTVIVFAVISVLCAGLLLLMTL